MSRSAGRLVLALVVVGLLALGACVSASSELQQSDDHVTSLRHRRMEVTSSTTTRESSSSTAGHEHVSSEGSATTKAEGETHGESEHPKGPSTSSFTGPLIAGVIAILLIGAVVAFKNRPSQ